MRGFVFVGHWSGVGRPVLTSGTDGAEREFKGAVDQRRVLWHAGHMLGVGGRSRFAEDTGIHIWPLFSAASFDMQVACEAPMANRGSPISSFLPFLLISLFGVIE